MNAPKRDDIADGNLLRSWGGSGQGYDWPQNEHGIFVDKDGSVWVGGNSIPSISA